MNMSENFLAIFPKLIPRNIHSKTPIFLGKNSELYICMEILQGTNAEFTWKRCRSLDKETYYNVAFQCRT
jgi:hypothetical protein